MTVTRLLRDCYRLETRRQALQELCGRRGREAHCLPRVSGLAAASPADRRCWDAGDATGWLRGDQVSGSALYSAEWRRVFRGLALIVPSRKTTRDVRSHHVPLYPRLERTVAILTLTAVHDIMKISSLLPTVTPEDAPYHSFAVSTRRRTWALHDNSAPLAK